MVSLLWLLGCGTAVLDEFENCSLDATLDVAVAAPGDVVVATGGPQFSTFDTAVRVGGLDAEVVEVERTLGCELCDQCRFEAAACTQCGFCPACDEACAVPVADTGATPAAPPEAGCLETVSFVVPDLPPGTAQVVVVNSFGMSAPTPLEIVGGITSTASTGETGTTATGATGDTGSPTLPTGDTSTTETGLETGDTAVVPTDTSDTADTAVSTPPPTDTSDTADTG